MPADVNIRIACFGEIKREAGIDGVVQKPPILTPGNWNPAFESLIAMSALLTSCNPAAVAKPPHATTTGCGIRLNNNMTSEQREKSCRRPSRSSAASSNRSCPEQNTGRPVGAYSARMRMQRMSRFALEDLREFSRFERSIHFRKSQPGLIDSRVDLKAESVADDKQFLLRGLDSVNVATRVSLSIERWTGDVEVEKRGWRKKERTIERLDSLLWHVGTNCRFIAIAFIKDSRRWRWPAT